MFIINPSTRVTLPPSKQGLTAIITYYLLQDTFDRKW